MRSWPRTTWPWSRWRRSCCGSSDTASRTTVVKPRHAQTHPLSYVHQLYIGPLSIPMLHTAVRRGGLKEVVCMSTRTRIPSGFGPAFLQWLRDKTETAWALHRPAGVEEIASEFAQTGIMGCQWQQSTRWLEGLSQAQIGQA